MNKYLTTNTFKKLAVSLLNHNEVILQGGKGSSKTTSVLQYLIFQACSKVKSDLIISIVADTLPNLKKNAIRIFAKLLKDLSLEDDFIINGTDLTWTHKETGSMIEFFSVQNDSSALGSRRQYLYMCESDGITFETYLAIAGRSEYTIMDFNPKKRFWVHTEELEKKSKTELFITTYLDNPYLPEAEVEQLLWFKSKAYHNPDIEDETLLNQTENIKSKFYLNKWLIFGKGLLGVAEGLIFPQYESWNMIDELPKEASYIGSSCDFGFSHVTAIVKLYEYNGKIIIHESLFKKGMIAPRIAEHILRDPQLLHTAIPCDSSRPEQIAEIRSHGCPVISHSKGDVLSGIDLMHSYDILITKSSINVIDEFNSYEYATDKRTGESLGVPNKSMDKDNSIDAARYGFEYFLSRAITRLNSGYTMTMY